MIFNTRGIVLKNVKYGESSAVVTIYTNLFGLQSYMVNGIRIAGKNSKIHLYQPGSILEMQVYHQPLKNLQRIKEASWSKVYSQIFSDVGKHMAALLIIELFQKSVRHEESNESLYEFLESTLLTLDDVSSVVAGNVTLLFSVLLPRYLGLQIKNNFNSENPWFDIREGSFTGEVLHYATEDDPVLNKALSTLLTAKTTAETAAIPLNGRIHRKILLVMEQYYKWHIEEFTELKTLRIDLSN